MSIYGQVKSTIKIIFNIYSITLNLIDPKYGKCIFNTLTNKLFFLINDRIISPVPLPFNFYPPQLFQSLAKFYLFTASETSSKSAPTNTSFQNSTNLSEKVAPRGNQSGKKFHDNLADKRYHQHINQFAGICVSR